MPQAQERKSSPASLFRFNCRECTYKKFPTFAALSKEEDEAISRVRVPNTYKRGQVIFYEGNIPYGLHIVCQGKVKIYKSGAGGRQQIVRLGGDGDVLGYRALLAEEPYTATAEAIEDCRVCFVDKNVFNMVLGQNRGVSERLLTRLAQDLRAAEDRLLDFTQRSASEKLADLLVTLGLRYGKKGKEGTVIDLSLSREELAEMVGITQETAIRVLSSLKERGIVHLSGREITISDETGLRKEAGRPEERTNGDRPGNGGRPPAGNQLGGTAGGHPQMHRP